ncbi:MAG TPA: hypothetical protein VN176_17670 [Verrucomicrobiae bacterium]|nr:hypothetical protein [Verrucomicrobiae bacterium]
MTKPSGYSEVDAMRDIDAALSKLDSDEQKRVVDWASSKHGIKLKANPDSSETMSEFVGDKMQHPKDVKSFLAQKRPENFYERVACLVYHLEKSEGKPEVGTNDITKANSDARLSKLTNPAVFVKHATHTYGYLTSLGKRKFAISARGEAVVEALPDRVKVEEAQEKFKFGKKGKRKGKSKK